MSASGEPDTLDRALSARSRSGARLRGGEQRLVVLFGLALAGLLIVVSPALLRDPDTYWHIAVGERIWTGGSVPWTDEFSHTFAGQPWIAKEWLSQLALFAAYAAAGWQGVVLLTVVAIAGSFALLLAILLRDLRWTAALSLTILAVILAASHFLARPHALAYLPVVVWTHGIIEAAERRERPPWTLALVMTLWANLHGGFTRASVQGGFTIGFVWGALTGAEAVFASPRERRRPVAYGWAAFLVLALLAACVSPYGLHGFLVTVRLFGSGESLAYISEWQPLQLDVAGGTALAALVAALAVLATRPRENAFRLLLVGLAGFMMLRHSRFVGLFGTTAAIAIAAPLARRFPALAAAGEDLPRWLDAQRQGRWRGLLAALSAAALATLVLRDPAPEARISPAAAVEAARRLDLTGPVYNSYDFGGYLIFRGIKTFVDGRSDQLFLDGFLDTLSRALADETGRPFLALLDKHSVRWAIVTPDSQAVARLASAPNWAKVYEDEIAIVYARR